MKKIVYLLSLCFIILVGCETIDIHTEHGFSVSKTEKVVFALGNLQYVVSEDKWQFAEDQLSYIGKRNFKNPTKIEMYSGWVSETDALGDTIDMFGWGTGNNPTLISQTSNDFESFVDWGKNKIGDYDENVWRTLTQEELNYLMNKRKDAILLRGIAQVCGVNGLLLLPDNWVCPKGVVFFPGYYGWEGSNFYAEHQSFGEKEWKLLEQSGAVFLPAVGVRMKYDFCEIVTIQSNGAYWTSSIYEYDNSYSSTLSFGSNRIPYESIHRKHSGLPVRLVRTLK